MYEMRVPLRTGDYRVNFVRRPGACSRPGRTYKRAASSTNAAVWTKRTRAISVVYRRGVTATRAGTPRRTPMRTTRWPWRIIFPSGRLDTSRTFPPRRGGHRSVHPTPDSRLRPRHPTPELDLLIAGRSKLPRQSHHHRRSALNRRCPALDLSHLVATIPSVGMVTGWFWDG